MIQIVIFSLFTFTMTSYAFEGDLYNDFPSEFRSINGTENNLENPSWGSAGIHLTRKLLSFYSDGISYPSGYTRPNPRFISNRVLRQNNSRQSRRGLTDLFWSWGQFIDHDMSFTLEAFPEESLDISVPRWDRFFDPDGTGEKVIPFNRSNYDDQTGTNFYNPRQQINSITSFLDASNVYGSDSRRARALKGRRGKLKVSEGNLLPFNTEGLPNAGPNRENGFLAGDLRANETQALISLHTLWVREHNRIVRTLNRRYPHLSSEELYQYARSLVGAQIQVITYREWLPALFGSNRLNTYYGYNESTNPTISNVFSTVGFRFGHTMLPRFLLRITANGSVARMPLRDTFFVPQDVVRRGIEPFLRGNAVHIAQEIDHLIVTDVRNFLFGLPGEGGFDLASLNIQRGRDHGIDHYNSVRRAFHLRAARTFAEVTSDREVAERLQETYEHINQLDPWVGMLAEDKLNGSSVGPLLFAILKDQFERLRDGDRFWYQATFSGRALAWLENQTLAKVIKRNTSIDSISDHVFRR